MPPALFLPRSAFFDLWHSDQELPGQHSPKERKQRREQSLGPRLLRVRAQAAEREGVEKHRLNDAVESQRAQQVAGRFERAGQRSPARRRVAPFGRGGQRVRAK
eukprot:4517183-Pleurochrysis_carterae.AAC.4